MSFEFKDGNEIVESVYSCTECIYCSTSSHFGEDDGDKICPLCRGTAEHRRTIRKPTGMRDADYQKMLDWLQENQSGIGSTTVENIRDAYPQGDDFLEACEQAYRNGEYAPLTEIDGVGKSHAKNKLALGLAEHEDWSGGVAESEFDFRKT